MDSLDSLFSSTAKVRLLRVIFSSNHSFNLRQLASICNLPVFSVQKALQQLADQNVIIMAKAGNKLLSVPNRQHSQAQLMRAVFMLEKKEALQKRAVNYSFRAKNALRFASEARTFFNRVRSAK